MVEKIFDMLPDSDKLLALEPEELAGIVIEFLNLLPPERADQLLNTHNFSQHETVEGYPPEKKMEIRKALMEAWSWLDREGLIAPRPGSMGSPWFFITRRGKQVLNRDAFRIYYQGNVLPKYLLHPIIAEKVWAHFIRGAYQSAVFEAFKAVEIIIRETGGYSMMDIGDKMIRDAFNEDRGKFTDLTLPKAERIALSNLFSGAYGLYRNPHGHRNVDIDQTEAVEMIILASHLFKIVEIRHGALAARIMHISP